jgi:hypothetical protein
MTSGNKRPPKEINNGAAAAKVIAKVYSQIDDLRTLASELPEPLQDKMLATIHAIKVANSRIKGNATALRSLEPDPFATLEQMLINESEFQGTLAALSLPLSDSRRGVAFKDALDAACAIREYSTRANALMALIPHLTEVERIAVLDQALSAVKSIDDVGRRTRILRTIARHALAEPIMPWDPYWRAFVEDAATQGRDILISDLSVVGAVIFRLGGPMAIEQSLHGLLDVGRWWP